MAKKQEINKSERLFRLQRIQTCTKCNGTPPVKECNLQGLIFNACEICLEVVGDHHKEGTPIIVKEIPSRSKHTDVNPVSHNLPQDIIPGKTSFNDLKI